MRKSFLIVLMSLFVMSIAIGALVTTASAAPPIPCTYKCINGDLYFCCLYKWGEACQFIQYGCPPPDP